MESITITTKPERLWGAHNSVGEDSDLLGCDTEWFLPFQRIYPSKHVEQPTKWHSVISQNTWIHYRIFCSKCGMVQCVCTAVAVTSYVLLLILKYLWKENGGRQGQQWCMCMAWGAWNLFLRVPFTQFSHLCTLFWRRGGWQYSATLYSIPAGQWCSRTLIVCSSKQSGCQSLCLSVICCCM